MTEIETKALTLAEQARAIRIVDTETYASACELARAIRDLRAAAEQHHRPVIRAALAAHRAALEAWRRVDEPLRDADAVIRRALAQWIAQEEQRRRAEEERVRAELEAARRRLIEDEAARLRAQGAPEDAIQTMVAQAQTLPAITVPPAHERPEGITARKTYRAEVVSLIELIRWVAQHPTHELLVQANQSALNALARAQRENLRIPGVRVTVEESLAIRRNADE